MKFPEAISAGESPFKKCVGRKEVHNAIQKTVAAARTPKRNPAHNPNISSGTLGALTPPPQTSRHHAPKLNPQKSAAASIFLAADNGASRCPLAGLNHVNNNGEKTRTAIALPAHHLNQV